MKFQMEESKSDNNLMKTLN